MENITRLSYISIRKANGDIVPDSPVPFVTNASNIKIETLEDEKNLYTELQKIADALSDRYTKAEADATYATKEEIENGYVLPLQKGLSENSVQSKDCIAGLKGYYWTDIDITNKKLTLDTCLYYREQIGTSSSGDPIFSEVIDYSINNGIKFGNHTEELTLSEEWKEGAVISIHNDLKHIDCSTIQKIEGNVITVDKLPFTEKIFELDITDNAVYILDAPNAGVVDFGFGAVAIGYQNKVPGIFSQSFGYNNITAGNYAFSSGNNTKAMGNQSHAEGNSTTASGNNSHAEGVQTKAIGNGAHAEGYLTKATGDFSHAEGIETFATTYASHAEGEKSKSGSYDQDIVHMDKTVYTANTQKNYTHAEGYDTKALGQGSHSEGKETNAIGKYSHAEGYRNYAIGEFTHTEGQETAATANQAHAEGYKTKASGGASHAEGGNTTASQTYAHAEGDSCVASGRASHAEGGYTKAEGSAAHAEGWQTLASGQYSHAEGNNTTASGNNSHAGGLGTKATAEAQTAIGKYNKENTNALFIVGNGKSTTSRSNALEILSNGDIVVSGITLTAEKLTKIIKFIDSIEEVTE